MATFPEPIQPWANHLEASLSFANAVMYVLQAQVAAKMSPESELGKAHLEFLARLKGTYDDPRGYFLAQLFVARVASFELFLQETISVVVRKYPKKVGAVEFRLSEILDCGDTSALLTRAAEEHLNRMMYKKPADYLHALCEILSINQAAIEDDWRCFVEAKARRDLGLHNAWRCNSIYQRKLGEVGLPCALALGESAVPQDHEYVNLVDSTLDRLATHITAQVLEKHWSELGATFAEACRA